MCCRECKMVQLPGLQGPWQLKVCKDTRLPPPQELWPYQSFFRVSCSWRSEGLFGQSFSVVLPVQALRGLPCLGMFIAALFIIARTWKQPRCPSAYEWIRKLWYIYTMEYYSAIKKNTFASVLMRWMKLEPIIHSEVSQKEKHKYSILTHIYGI